MPGTHSGDPVRARPTLRPFAITTGRRPSLPLEPWFEAEGEGFDLEDRQALRRVAGLATELEDVTEVEYRQLRLERVVLIGVWDSGTQADAENSLAELAVARRDRRLAGARRAGAAAGQA